ncbi:sensor histidine kinase [Nonomuraea fuscirosea]|uniref:sensor histidine kinase n=1 Tax=Nonomuraea fuscirosea TaxID=1291556 RepID=UPI00341B46B2
MDTIEQARRTTWKVLVVNVVAMWVLIAISILAPLWAGRFDGWWRIGPALVAAVCFTWLCTRIMSLILDRRHYPTKQVAVAAVLAVVATGLGGADPFGWGFVALCWLGIATLEIPKRAVRLLQAGTFVLCLGLSTLPWQTGTLGVRAALTGVDVEPSSWQSLAYHALAFGVFCLIVPPSNRIWVWIWRLAVEAHRGREAHTRLALAEERLRFARDLHDLVGHQLSAIAVKTELAVRLSDVDAGRAKEEMAEVNRLTRKALKELREAVRGYRELDLAAELNSVKGVLEAAGVRCEVRLPYRELPAGVAPVFAYAVREAVTNVLKHSTATFCDITIRFTEQEAELTVRNDGVARRQADDLGSGLTGMSERLGAVGGTMKARLVEDREFLLHAVVSLPIDG